MIKLNTKTKETKLTAVVTRADGTVEHLGTIAYYHSNPFRRLLWNIRQFFKHRRS